jgi:ABC-2 type transport system permease protein
MTTISSIAFFLSCFRIKPAAATIGALTYILVDFIMRLTSGFMDNYQHLLSPNHMACWGLSSRKTSTGRSSGVATPSSLQ